MTRLPDFTRVSETVVTKSGFCCILLPPLLCFSQPPVWPRRAAYGPWDLRPRPHRGHYPCGRPAGPLGGATLPQLPAAALPLLRPELLPRHLGPPCPARPRRPAAGPAPGPARGLLQAPLRGLPPLLLYQPLRPGPAGQPLHPPGRCPGRTPGGRGRPALPHGLLALVA